MFKNANRQVSVKYKICRNVLYCPIFFRKWLTETMHNDGYYAVKKSNTINDKILALKVKNGDLEILLYLILPTANGS